MWSPKGLQVAIPLSEHEATVAKSHLRRLLQADQAHANADAHSGGAVGWLELQNIAVGGQGRFELFAAKLDRGAAWDERG
jgi:hypothetical protein